MSKKDADHVFGIQRTLDEDATVVYGIPDLPGSGDRGGRLEKAYGVNVFLSPTTIFDSCLLGVIRTDGKPVVACYDREKCIAELSKVLGHDATEFFETHTAVPLPIEETPVFLSFTPL